MKNKWADEGYHNKNSSDNSKDNVYQPRSLCKNTKNGKIAFKPKTLLIIENDRILSRLTMERQNLKEALLHDQFVRKTYWNFDYFLKKFQAIRSRHKQSNLNVVISDERWYLYIIAKYCFGFFGLFWKNNLQCHLAKDRLYRWSQGHNAAICERPKTQPRYNSIVTQLSSLHFRWFCWAVSVLFKFLSLWTDKLVLLSTSTRLFHLLI